MGDIVVGLGLRGMSFTGDEVVGALVDSSGGRVEGGIVGSAVMTGVMTGDGVGSCGQNTVSGGIACR